MAKKRAWQRKPSFSPKSEEQGAITSKRQGRLNIALVYPNTYSAGMSNLGFQTVYALFNAHPHGVCHRFFLDPNRQKKHHPHGNRQQMPKSVETGMPLSHYDMVALSISFENDYLNIVTLLQSAHIPTRSSDRDADHPLIIAGGVATYLNPEPIAPFVDCFLLGEAEVSIPRFIEHALTWESNVNGPITPFQIEKKPFLEQLSISMEGIYVPELYQIKWFSSDESDESDRSDRSDKSNKSDQCPPPHHLLTPPSPKSPKIPETIIVPRSDSLGTLAATTQILTPDTAFSDTFLIETGRGCPHGCRFCSAGFIYRPPRFTPKAVVIDAMKRAREMTCKIGLVSAAVSDHPDINTICAAGVALGHHISFSSLRLDNLTDETLDTLVAASVKTATIAPEAGSERMRRIINKKITEEEILSAVKRIVAHGILNIKLYFMVGLPFETKADVQAIIDLTLKIKQVFLEVSREKGKIGTITLSINPFIPKPATPFQWAAMDRPTVYKKKVKQIQEGLKREGNVVVNAESPKTAEINALLARGDRRMADVLERATEVGWPATLRDPAYAAKLPPIYTPLDPSDSLPWDIVDTGIKKSFLIHEFHRAEKEKMTADCPLKQCKACGICKKSEF